MTKKPICWGAGLIALDIIMNGSPDTPPRLSAGGSCGNVMTILSYLGWSAFPIARLGSNNATHELLEDLNRWGVKNKFISATTEGSTAIIIHRILKNKAGKPVHRFEFKKPNTNQWLPGYKPVLSKEVEKLSEKLPAPKLFYFDRVSRATIELAKIAKSKGAIVFFEPSSIGDPKHFRECLTTTDIIKFSSDRIPEYKTEFKKSKVPLEIETLGEKGINFRLKGSGKWNLINSYSISEVVDAAGAGDWCSAGIIMSLCGEGAKTPKDWSKTYVASALKTGQFYGALNCFFDGARGIMYDLNKKTFDTIVSVKNISKSSIKREEILKKTESNYKKFVAADIDRLIFSEI
ncbi:hypothetical protein BH10BAC4_BH10BAC4_02340 [soil metagenome]